jgi:hypothetical protein
MGIKMHSWKLTQQTRQSWNQTAGRKSLGKSKHIHDAILQKLGNYCTKQEVRLETEGKARVHTDFQRRNTSLSTHTELLVNFQTEYCTWEKQQLITVREKFTIKIIIMNISAPQNAYRKKRPNW